ncbi:MAG TPA: uroporphyrinogen decarboxylase family protein [bacterium]|nr:uroporphyrinogen decarboxylase family protein [bacterium]HPR88877.1 uroporphyrinogen decarboxylase family protein [bacterium]
MTDPQWELLLKLIRGEQVEPLPAGFIIDCPWLPNWYGIRILDYFTNDELWLKANLKAIAEFPEILFLPGFWSEFGMCTEPSAFGARTYFPANEFPHAHRVIRSTAEIADLPVPNPATDGLLPFVLNRLQLARPAIEAAGHRIRFAVARGPLNIASYLMGSTEFLMAMMLEPEKVEKLLQKITAFLKSWLQLQMETFPSIDGIFMLDDIIGFIGENEFRTFGLPCFKELYSLPVTVKFLHNDAPCRVSAPYLPEMGVNLFNMGFDIPLNELQNLTRHQVALVGNLPPRDVLASGTPAVITAATQALVAGLSDRSRILLSCGGGMPPGVSSAQIAAFLRGCK